MLVCHLHSYFTLKLLFYKLVHQSKPTYKCSFLPFGFIINNINPTLLKKKTHLIKIFQSVYVVWFILFKDCGCFPAAAVRNTQHTWRPLIWERSQWNQRQGIFAEIVYIDKHKLLWVGEALNAKYSTLPGTFLWLSNPCVCSVCMHVCVHPYWHTCSWIFHRLGASPLLMCGPSVNMSVLETTQHAWYTHTHKSSLHAYSVWIQLTHFNWEHGGVLLYTDRTIMLSSSFSLYSMNIHLH